MSSRSSKNSGAERRAPSGARANPPTAKVSLGRIVRAHGIAGRVILAVDRSVADAVVPGLQVFLDDSETARPYEVLSAAVHGNGLLVQFDGLTSRNDAEAVSKREVFVRRDALAETGADEYYEFDIIGASVITQAGQELGRVVEIIVTGANDVYLVEGPKGEVLIPAIAAAVIEIDASAGRIVVNPEAVEFSSNDGKP